METNTHLIVYNDNGVLTFNDVISTKDYHKFQDLVAEKIWGPNDSSILPTDQYICRNNKGETVTINYSPFTWWKGVEIVPRTDI